MPVSTEKNFEEKFELFKEWLTQQDSFKDKGHLVSTNTSSIASDSQTRLLFLLGRK